MKKSAFLLLLITSCITKSAFSQDIEKTDSLGLPGDNLNLVAVLDLFQKSETFDIFEKQLNLEDSKINNLDLNNDDKTDYIKVVDHQTGESHAVVLQVLINEKETQDVAVIEIEKDKAGKILVQIIGNEELYGKDYIVEPSENDPTAKSSEPDKKPDTAGSSDGKTVIINNTTNNYTRNTNTPNSSYSYVVVSHWPIIHYVYAPAYVVYVSPWYWYSYPSWWRPWAPLYWHSYYGHHHNHYGHYYHRTNYYRAPVAHGYYGPRKSVSSTVQKNRSTNVYHKTYNSQNRAGDGKIERGTSNPAFNNKPVNKATPDSRQKPNNGINKPNTQPNTKPRVNRPHTKFENKPSDLGNKPSSRPATKPVTRPSSKPVQKQGGSKSGNKGGGGKGR